MTTSMPMRASLRLLALLGCLFYALAVRADSATPVLSADGASCPAAASTLYTEPSHEHPTRLR